MSLHKNLSAKNLFHRLAARPRFERRLPVKVGRISNPMGYPYPTAPYERDYNLKSLPGSRRPIFICIPLLVISNVRRRRRAGLMAIRAVYGGSGRIRTHGSVTSQMISSQRRYAHFGTLPLFIRKSFYSFMQKFFSFISCWVFISRFKSR